MSHEAVSWALRQTPETSSAKFVLVVLAETANPKSWTSRAGRLWPPMHALLSVAALCQTTMQDRKTVMVNLARLERAGLIQRAGTDGRTNQIPVYRLPVTSTEMPTGSEAPPVPISESTGTSFSADQSQFSLSPVPKEGHGTRRNQKVNQKEPEERARQARAARTCPSSFEISTTMKAWALKECPGVNVEAETAKFRDHEYPKAKSDWTAAWRNWIRIAGERRGTAPARAQTPRTFHQQDFTQDVTS